MMTKEQVEAAYAHTMHNRAEIARSGHFCSISCRLIFPSGEVTDWIDDKLTAMCPYCDVDAVIGDASGCQLTDDFINTLHDEYFDYGIE